MSETLSRQEADATKNLLEQVGVALLHYTGEDRKATMRFLWEQAEKLRAKMEELRPPLPPDEQASLDHMRKIEEYAALLPEELAKLNLDSGTLMEIEMCLRAYGVDI